MSNFPNEVFYVALFTLKYFWITGQTYNVEITKDNHGAL